MQGTLLAAIHPDNTPHGYNWTFAFPMLMFIIVAGALYLRFRSPHRVPGHVALGSSRWANAASAVAVTKAATQGPTAEAAATEAAATMAADQAAPADDGGANDSAEDSE